MKPSPSESPNWSIQASAEQTLSCSSWNRSRLPVHEAYIPSSTRNSGVLSTLP